MSDQRLPDEELQTFSETLSILGYTEDEITREIEVMQNLYEEELEQAQEVAECEQLGEKIKSSFSNSAQLIRENSLKNQLFGDLHSVLWCHVTGIFLLFMYAFFVYAYDPYTQPRGWLESGEIPYPFWEHFYQFFIHLGFPQLAVGLGTLSLTLTLIIRHNDHWKSDLLFEVRNVFFDGPKSVKDFLIRYMTVIVGLHVAQTISCIPLLFVLLYEELIPLALFDHFFVWYGIYLLQWILMGFLGALIVNRLVNRLFSLKKVSHRMARILCFALRHMPRSKYKI